MRGTELLHPHMMGLAEKLVLKCGKKGYPVKITETFRSKQIYGLC